MSKKKLTEDQLYQNYINEGDTGGLSGIRSTITGSPVETIGTIPEFTRSQKLTNALNQQQAGIQKVSDIYGITDFGKSSYDIDIESASGLNDLEDTRANIQPLIDKIGAGIGTFAGKTVTATIGGLGTLFYGVPKAIIDGKFSSIFDNDLNKALNDINSGIDENMKVYASQSERNGNFWDQTLGSTNWWTKSLLGDGMSFTAGAVLSAYAMGGIGSLLGAGSEAVGLTGAVTKIGESGEVLSKAGLLNRGVSAIGKGISKVGGFSDEASNAALWTKNEFGFGQKLISKTANTLKGASGAFDGSQMANSLSNATKWEKLVGGIDKVGGMATKLSVGSMYEGGVEANDFIDQSITKYKQQVYEQTGNIPTDEELDDYKLKILPAANALFAANVVLVGGSYMATIPSVFGKGVNETIKSARKNIARKVVDDVIKPVLKDETLSGFEKGAKLAWRAAKAPLSEGAMEEGGQNFAKNMALDYVDKHYNPDAAKNTYDMMNSFGNALNQAYGTVDGWKEIMAGMVIGGFGAPNLKAIGRFETSEDGKKSWNPLKLDKEKSWWTGGIIGEFQDHHEANARAKELIDNYESQDKDTAFKYFSDNLSQNQGIAGQISEINHQNALGKIMDEAVEAGDFYTAKNAEQDKFHSYIKSRVDAGYFDVLEKELIDPIKDMSEDEYADAFGYQNKTKEELKQRKEDTIKSAEKSIKDTVDAINFVDSRMSFNLGSEDGRNHRDMLIYALATNKSVGNRIEQLNSVIKETTSGKLKYTHNDENFDKIEKVFRDKIDELEKTKTDKSDEEVSKIDEKISELQDKINSTNYGREQSKKAEKLVKDGLSAPSSAIEAKEFAEQIMNIYSNDKDISPEAIKNKEKLESALQDLPKLLRRKEEAFELYSTAKDPKTWDNFVKTERLQERWEKLRNEIGKSIANAQNEEHAQAETLVNEGTDPETIHTVTGTDMSTIEKILNHKKSVEDAKIAKSLDELLASINSKSEHKFENKEELLESLMEIVNDENSSEEEHDSAMSIANRINELIESSRQLATIIDESVPSKDGLLDKDQNISPVAENIVDETNNINEDSNTDLKKDDKTNTANGDSDLLVDAFNHIAWNNVLYDNKTGKFVYQGINPKASKLLQDYTKLKIGQKVEFRVNPTAEFPAEDLEHIKIDVIINGEVVGQIHTVDYINSNRVVDTDGNLERNISELKELRNSIISGQIKESTIGKVGNGRLITAREFGGNKTDNIPTIDALPGKNAFITVVNNGVIATRPKNSIIINEGKINAGTDNNFRNGMFALLPINQSTDGTNRTKYIAASLSPVKLNETQSQTISTLIELFLRNQSGQIDAKTKSIFDAIAKEMHDKMKYRYEVSDQEMNFNPQSLNGLRNIIKLFTYDRVSLSDDLNESGESRADKKIFGINQMKNGSIVVSFGTPKNVTSYKIQQNPDGQFEFFIKKPTIGPIISKWELADSVDSFFSELGNGTESHLKQSFFYHNKALIDQIVNVPTLEMSEDGLSVKFDTKPYTQFIKENTQTNLRSVDLGNGNYSYTVQRNIVFATPRMEEAKKYAKTIVSPNPNVSNESTTDRLNRQRKFDLEMVNDMQIPFQILKTQPSLVEYFKSIKEGSSEIFQRKQLIKLINTKYDLELSKSQPEQKPEVREKPKLQQRRGNGKSIERKKPLSEEDLLPSFSEIIDEQVGFEIKEKSPSLQMDFITYAKLQPNEIKRSLIAMNRNKEIEVKCK